MSRIKKKVTITLKSDLCTASGFSYAGVVDTDVMFDENGMPYISGRRLKGCMKEAAVTYLGFSDERIKDIFGESDQQFTNSIQISNAFPESYNYINWSVIKNESKFKKYINEEDLIEMYTSVRGQTALTQEQIADENSLRFIRVINHYDPLNLDELRFECEVYLDENDLEDFENICKATRNIGSNRNRGLGSVKIEVNDFVSEGVNKKELIDKDELPDSEKVTLKYVVENIEPLMLSTTKNSISEDYISGTMVLGALATIYLRNNSVDANFERLFLNGETEFSNLTLAKKGNKWEKYYPAPLYINKLKKTNKLINTLVEDKTFSNDSEDEKYEIKGGNIPKKLKTHYVYTSDEKNYSVKEVGKEIFYHHSKHGKNKENKEGILYFLDAVEAGQYFAGEIIVKKDLVPIILELLSNDLQFGKSKTAQYGRCVLADKILCEEYKDKITDFSIKSGDKVVVTLLSDGIFMDDSGNYVTDIERVTSIVARDVSEDGLKLSEEDTSFLETKIVTGYNSKWGRRKVDKPAIKAGSAFVFKAEKDIQEIFCKVGEFNSEGFGKYKIAKLDDMVYRITEEKQKDTVEMKYDEYTKQIISEMLVKDWYRTKLAEKYNRKNEIKIGNSSLGRFTLMLQEAVEENKENEKDIFRNLDDRVASIKNNSTRREIEEFLDKEFGKDHCDENAVINTLIGSKDTDDNIYKLLLDIYDSREDKVNEALYKKWNVYLQRLLTEEKYKKAIGKER